MWVAFANAKATHIFFSKNIIIYTIFNDQSFNNILTKDTVSFEQPGPGKQGKSFSFVKNARMLTKNIQSSLMIILFILDKEYETAHDKTYKMACVPSEDSDQYGHLPSLIRVFAVHSMDS